MTHRVITVLFICLILQPVAATASDLAKEKRWADQIVDALLDGEAEWLNDGKSDFLAIYTPAASDRHRAVILMHGTGVHPDWQQVIQPLRVNLTEHGWHTLSIQMPVLPNEADYEDYAPLYDEVAPRINAAIAWLRKQGIKQIVLIGHSQGASMAAYYLRQPHPALDGFVAIGMPGQKTPDDRQDTLKALSQINIPVLDLSGTDDLPEVLDTANARALAAKSKSYTQIAVDGANHFFDGHEDELTKTVSTWLEKL